METRGNIRKINGHSCLHVDETDSTNSLLERLNNDHNLENGYVVVADFQNSGKGMLENFWMSKKGENLLFSVFLKHENLTVDKQFYLSKSISLALWDVISNYSDSHTTKIKWPNDLLMNEGKLAGILIKNTLKNSLVTQSIVGIGLNVNQVDFPDQIRATSLSLELGKAMDQESILHDLLQSIDKRMEELKEKKYSEINLDYHNNLHSFKKWVSYKKGQDLFEGRIFEVCDDGRVLIEKKDGSFSKFEVKEITLIRE